MILFAHGLEGTPTGTKIRALQAAGLSVEAPDCRLKVLADRVALLEAASERLASQRPLLVGSSYGGLAAAWVASQHPERFRGLLLLAPALHYAEKPVPPNAQLFAPDGLPTILIHGLGDDVVPVSASRGYLARSGPGVTLREVDDGHRLIRSLDVIVASARALLGGGGE